jgi:hypothetical protein
MRRFVLKKRSSSEHGFISPRVAFAGCLAAIGLAMLSVSAGSSDRKTVNKATERGSADTGAIRRGVFRDMPVAYVVKNGKAIFQGDIILDKVDSVNPGKSQASAGIKSLGVAYSQYLWPRIGNQVQIPYTIGAGSGNVTNLNNAITQFNNTFANIKFVPRTAQIDYVNFYFDPNLNNGQCEANLGRAGGQQEVGGAGGSFNPCVVGTILHEMGHTIGLWHEHVRPDRDTYVSVSYSNVIKGSLSNFIKQYDDAQQTTLFDYGSIMEYPAFSFSRNGGPVIETIPAGIPLAAANGYSAADIDGVLRLYGQAPTAVTITSNPVGLQVIVDGNTITTPQVFNWAINSTHTLNVSSTVQSQAGFIGSSNQATTFYYTYGRWNDSTSAFHMITVLPGNGAPGVPVASPAVTTYTANFIQLVPYSVSVFPTGTGTVTPSPMPQSYPGSGLVFYVARQQATLTATPNAGQNFYAFINGPFWLAGGLSANPKTFYVPNDGLTVNTSALFSPNPVYTVNVAPNSFSSNLYIYADGNFSYAPKSFSAFYDSGWTAGSSHTLAVDAVEYPYSFGSRYSFSNWSDGANTASHSVVLPATNTTYTANLTPEFYVTDSVNQSCAGSINVTPASPTADGFYPSGTILNFSEMPNTGWLFTGWQYDLSGTSTPQMLIVTDEVLVAADYNTTTTPLALTSLSPASVVSGAAALTLTLTGTGFTPSTVVSVNGAFPSVNFINSTQITVPVTASQVAQPGTFQVWADNFPTGAGCAAFVALPFTVNNRLVSVASRMTHGGTGTFDVNLPLTGLRGVESRSSSSLGSGNYTLIFTFTDSLTSVTGASITGHDPGGGTGNVLNSSLGPAANQCTVNLTNVSNGQYLTVKLNSVLDSAGRNGDVNGPQMGILVGDTNGNGSVNAGDITQTKIQSGQAVTATNFRQDVNANGSINAGDISLVKTKSGTSLP